MMRTFEHIRDGEAPASVVGVFVDARHCLRTTWVPLPIRALATRQEALKPIWQQLRPNLLTRACEESADDLRTHLATAAVELGTPLIEPVLLAEGLDVDAIDEVREVVDAFHYVNPKLLVLLAALVEASRGQVVGGAHLSPPLLESFQPGNIPDEMPDIVPLPEEPGGLTGEIFHAILETTHLPVATPDLRVLGRWPHLLEAAWPALKPVFQHKALERVIEGLRKEAIAAARALPHRMTFGVDEETQGALIALTPALQVLFDGGLRLALFASALKVSLDGVEDALASPHPIEWTGDDELEQPLET